LWGMPLALLLAPALNQHYKYLGQSSTSY